MEFDNAVGPKNELDWFIYKLRLDGNSNSPDLRLARVNNIGMDVEQVIWGVQLSFLSSAQQYIRVESYFEAFTGTHIATHFGNHVITEVGVRQMTIELADLISSRQMGNKVYDLSDLTYLDFSEA